MTYWLFLFGVFFICMAMLWTEGFWGNAVTWVNVMVSAMIAMTFWEPAANALTDQMPTFTYVLDIVTVWLLFAITMGILRTITARLSKFKVRFHRLTEMIGNMAMSVVVGVTMTLFTAWTLNVAPLAPMPFRGVDISSQLPSNLWNGAMGFSSRGTMGGGGQSPLNQVPQLYRARRQALSELEGLRTSG